MKERTNFDAILQKSTLPLVVSIITNRGMENTICKNNFAPLEIGAWNKI